MRFPPLVEGRFIKRLNRFAALVDVDKREYLVHVPNSGRMHELLVPGFRVLLIPAPEGTSRKTAFDLALVDIGTTLSSADARLPNKLVAEAIAEGRLPQFAEYPDVYPERVFGESRLDFLLEGPKGSCYVETKSVTLVEEGVGLFPDAPTLRGVKHLHSLMAAMDAGHRAGVIFRDSTRRCGCVRAARRSRPAVGRNAAAGGGTRCRGLGLPLPRQRAEHRTGGRYTGAAVTLLMDIYQRLLDAYGPQGWWPGDSRFEIIAGAILTQAAAWRNVELALFNLKEAGVMDWPTVHRIEVDALAQLVRSSGYYNAKARKLKAFAAHVCEGYGGDLDAMFASGTDALRQELLGIYGIGPETADDILVYAAGKPSFVIDAYTIRIMRRVGLSPDGRNNYAGWQATVPRRDRARCAGVQRVPCTAGPAP